RRTPLGLTRRHLELLSANDAPRARNEPNHVSKSDSINYGFHHRVLPFLLRTSCSLSTKSASSRSNRALHVYRTNPCCGMHDLVNHSCSLPVVYSRHPPTLSGISL